MATTNRVICMCGKRIKEPVALAANNRRHSSNDKEEKGAAILNADEVWNFGEVWRMVTKPNDQDEKYLSGQFQSLMLLPPPRHYAKIRDTIKLVLRDRRAQLPEKERASYCKECGLPLGITGHIRAGKLQDGRVVERPAHTKQHLWCTAESAQRDYNRDKRAAKRTNKKGGGKSPGK